MSAAQIAARKAIEELEQTAAAFDRLHTDYIEALLSAETSEAAWIGVLRVRALGDVRQTLLGVQDNAKIEEKYRE